MTQLTTRRVCYIVLGLHLFLVLIRLVNDPDIWWHLRTGQYILQTFNIPHVDTYSFTVFGKPWVAHEWLSEAAMYGIYRLAGWIGLITISSLIAAAVFLYVARKCEAPPQIVLLATVGSQAAALVVLRDPRPRLATLLFSAIFFMELRDYVRDVRKHLWLLPILTIGWVNSHAGYPIGFVFIILAAIALLLDGRQELLPYLALIFGLCLVAVSINPYGVRMYSYPFETQFSAVQMSVISEWNAPDFRERDTLPFLLLLLGIIAALGFSKKRLSWYEMLSLMFACFLSLRSKRHISLLSLVSIPILAEQSWDWISSTPYGQRTVKAANST